MSIRFDDQVAIVTGAGNGLGRSYALGLAARGAKVVVNDLGGASVGGGHDPQVAQAVTEEIRRRGGTAIANDSSVTDDAGVARLVEETLGAFGRIDILVTNAGIHRAAPFADMTVAEFQDIMSMHLMGTVRCIKAVWNRMCARGYGRVVVATSTVGLFGFPNDAHYGAGKMGVIGLMNTLQMEGAPHGIHVNAIAPIAATRMGRDAVAAEVWEPFARAYSPDFVAPAVLYLASREAPTGMILTAGGGVFACARMLGARGANLGTAATPEAIAAHWSAISDFTQPVAFSKAIDHGAYCDALIARGVDP